MEAKMTKTGREQLCKAHGGEQELSPVTFIALGSGGCNSGQPILVTGDETELKSELVRKNIESYQYVEESEGSGAVKIKMRYTASLSEDELVDSKISEAGLLDESGSLVAYITFLEKGKDQGMEFTFVVDEIF